MNKNGNYSNKLPLKDIWITKFLLGTFMNSISEGALERPLILLQF